MFTVCPKCALTLVVTAADLRVAQGYVRCGRCLSVFNALARLSEERPGAAPPPPDTAATGSSEQAEPPQPTPSPPDAAATGSSEHAEPPQPSEPSSSLEETGEIEIELDASVLAISTEAAAEPQDKAQLDAEPHPPGSAATDQEELPAPEEAAAEPAAAQEPAPSPPTPPDDAAAREGAAVGSGEEPHSAGPPGPPPAPESAETSAASDAAADTQHTNTPPQPPESAFELATRNPRAALGWRLGAGALAVALALQIVNHYRDALAGNPTLRKPLATVYSALGVTLAPHWNVHAYDVRQLGASVVPSATGEIVVRASVKNAASRAQPLPLLRVTLQDRFGNRIAARDVPPGDYLPSPVAPGALLAAGSRVDATMVFVDPGPKAVGFEIDACLRQRGGLVACAHGP